MRIRLPGRFRTLDSTQLLLMALAAVLAYLFVVPMVYTLISSLKPRGEVFEFPIRWIPRHIRWANFTEPFLKRNFGRYFFNSALVASTVTASSLFFSSMGGYSLSKFKYRMRNTFFLLVMLAMMFPIEITMVPLAIVVKYMGIMNTRIGLIAPVMISWNSLIWPMIVATKDAIRTIPVGLVMFVGEFQTVWNELFVMSVVAVVPTLVVFLILRGRLIKGMAMVGLKGLASYWQRDTNWRIDCDKERKGSGRVEGRKGGPCPRDRVVALSPTG